MVQEYVPENPLSITLVSERKWQMAIWGFIGTILIGIILLILLALGASNPPRAGQLVWQADTAESWRLRQNSDEFDLYVAPTSLPTPPFTLELNASNSGDMDSAWGVWLQSADDLYTILVSREGYLSVSDDGRPHWAEFMHIQSLSNKISLNVTSDYSATLRINDEIAWTGTVSDIESWGAANYNGPELSWQGITIYG